MGLAVIFGKFHLTLFFQINVVYISTVGLWVKLSSIAIANNRGWVLTQDDRAYDRSIILHDIRFGAVAAGVGDVYISTLPQITTNKWHCVAVAYDHEGDEATVFYDGQTQILETRLDSGRTEASLGGSWLWPNSHEIDGLVDEVFIFDEYLSAEEIGQVCNMFRDD